MIDKKTIDKVASLSRIALQPDEEALIVDQMKRIVNHFDTLQNVSTDGVEPLYTPVDMENIWREDEEVDLTPSEVLLDQAPDKQEGQVKVPQVVK